MHIYVRSNPYFRAKFDENMAKSAYCLISFLFLAGSLFRDGQLYAQDTTVTWQTCLQHYKRLDEACNYASLIQIGETDQGQPLHCFVINSDGVFEPEKWSRDKVVLLINNNIHPGEPDGVESSMQLSASLCNTGHSLSTSLKNVIVCIIPMYNVDGAMVRSGYFRANQNGPKESGFRGNALNLDLNRDFIKCDSQNALTFCNWFTRVLPHVMIDTHVSNGADYAYTMTLITTQSDKLGYTQGSFVRNSMEPELFRRMEKTKFPMAPYVNTMGRTPESGIEGFLETARFATGYAALFGTLGFTTETHMLKPFRQRVEATSLFLNTMLQYLSESKEEILRQYAEGRKEILAQEEFPLHFELDTTVKNSFQFDGFKAREEPALIGEGQRLRYDRSEPWRKPIPYFNRYNGKDYIKVPEAYIVPGAWRRVIERLDANHVQYKVITQDTVMHVKVSYIDKYETARNPFEGHYYHYKTTCRDTTVSIVCQAGDRWIPTNQIARRFLVQVLEPRSDEGYFAWNFFDSMLQQKEWFSDYVFEEIAAELLKSNKDLQQRFEQALRTDKNLSEDHWQQLYWVYKNSDYYEPTAYRIPVYRIY